MSTARRAIASGAARQNRADNAGWTGLLSRKSIGLRTARTSRATKLRSRSPNSDQSELPFRRSRKWFAQRPAYRTLSRRIHGRRSSPRHTNPSPCRSLALPSGSPFPSRYPSDNSTAGHSGPKVRLSETLRFPGYLPIYEQGRTSAPRGPGSQKRRPSKGGYK